MPQPINVTETELAILNVLWHSDTSTIRAITNRLYKRGTTGEYATVQKLLDRLEAKGCVRRDRGSFQHTFTAIVERDALIGQGLEQLASQLCEGSFTPLLIHLVETTKLSRQERDVLRDMIEQAEAKKSRGRGTP